MEKLQLGFRCAGLVESIASKDALEHQLLEEKIVFEEGFSLLTVNDV